MHFCCLKRDCAKTTYTRGTRSFSRSEECCQDRFQGGVQPKDKVVPFLTKLLYLVAAKLSREVVPFCQTQGNSGDLSGTMVLSVFVFFLRSGWV